MGFPKIKAPKVSVSVPKVAAIPPIVPKLLSTKIPIKLPKEISNPGANPLDTPHGKAQQKIAGTPTPGESIGAAGDKGQKQSEAAAQDYLSKSGVISGAMTEADKKYLDQYNKALEPLLGGSYKIMTEHSQVMDDLSAKAQDQSTNAESTYTNSILPEYKHAMGQARTNADQAMTLAQAGDPNNPIMSAVRDLYGKQGQAARLQGQQDYGVLSSLGAQAAQGQFGAAGPMTAGQMGQIYAANQGQAGDAYARAQQRMYDLQQQGIDKGFDQSNLMYQFGQDARGRYSDTIKDLQGGEADFYGLQQGFRDELGGYADAKAQSKQGFQGLEFGGRLGAAEAEKGIGYAGGGREQAALDKFHGYIQAGIDAETAAKIAGVQANTGLLGTVLGAGASIYGAG